MRTGGFYLRLVGTKGKKAVGQLDGIGLCRFRNVPDRGLGYVGGSEICSLSTEKQQGQRI
jgi:hypothetical protein